MQTTLGEFADITIGRTPPRNDVRYWTTDLSRPFCTIADMSGRSIDPSREGVSKLAETEGKAKRVPEGALLMSFKLSIGKIGFAARDLFPNEAIAWLRVTNVELTEQFLALWLESQDLTLNSGRAVKGNTLNGESLRAIPVLVPTLAEQWRIVDMVGAIDACADAVRHELVEVDRLTTALLDELVVEARSKSTGVTRLGDVLAAPATYGVLKPGHEVTNGVPLIRGQDIKRGTVVSEQVRTISTRLDAEYERSRVRADDIIMVLVGTPGACALVPADLDGANISRAVGRLRSGSDVVPDYLLMVLNSTTGQAALRAETRGAVQQMINLKQLREISIPVPGLQHQVYLSARGRAAMDLGRSIRFERDRLLELRGVVLNNLLSGSVNIRDAFDGLLDPAS